MQPDPANNRAEAGPTRMRRLRRSRHGIWRLSGKERGTLHELNNGVASPALDPFFPEDGQEQQCRLQARI